MVDAMKSEVRATKIEGKRKIREGEETREKRTNGITIDHSRPTSLLIAKSFDIH